MINGIEKKNISVKELKKDGRYLNAALYTPKTEPGKTYPLVLFLHGAGERGDDLNLVLDFTPGADTFMTDAWQAEHPCFVLAPQCPENQCWVPYVDLLAQSLLEMAAQYPVDICRLYVTGVSMGGAGTWELLTRYPHKIAAAMPICGYAEPFKLRAAKRCACVGVPCRRRPRGAGDGLLPLAARRGGRGLAYGDVLAALLRQP